MKPLQVGSVAQLTPSQSTTIPAQSSTSTSIDINAIFNLMLMVMVIGMMGKMMGKMSF